MWLLILVRNYSFERYVGVKLCDAYKLSSFVAKHLLAPILFSDMGCNNGSRYK